MGETGGWEKGQERIAEGQSKEGLDKGQGRAVPNEEDDPALEAWKRETRQRGTLVFLEGVWAVVALSAEPVEFT